MAGTGLSYDQAPPFGTPLRLFLAAPVFLVLGALLAMASPDAWLSSRWTPQALALTHLLTLGYLGTVMLGALSQMLPVVVGAPVPAAGPLGWLALIGLGAGTPLLAAGFLLGEPSLLALASGALTLGLLPFLAGALVSLIRARALPQVAWPMRQAWLGLLLTLGLGILLTLSLMGIGPGDFLPDFTALVALHAAWGLGGWVLTLVMGVAYQVVPMLQLTPPYPGRVMGALTWALPAALGLYTLAAFLPPPTGAYLGALTLLAGLTSALVFAIATLGLQRRRRRKLGDATLDFWRLGMASLILAALLLPAALLAPDPWRDPAQLALGLAFLPGFAASVVNGMLYKIVPFLGWFHLRAQIAIGTAPIPTMKDFISDAAARRHYRLHLAAVALLLPVPWLPSWTALPGLALLAVSGGVLGVNLLQARRIFLAHGGRL